MASSPGSIDHGVRPSRRSRVFSRRRARYDVAPYWDANATAYADAISSHFGVDGWYGFDDDAVDEIVDHYDPELYDGDATAAFISADADYAVTCPTLALADAARRATKSVWLYFYSHLQQTDVSLEAGLVRFFASSRSFFFSRDLGF